jgi:hypothetical protein
MAQLSALRQAVAIHCGENLKAKGPILFFIPPHAAPEIRRSYDDAIRLLTERSGSKFSPVVIEVNSLSEGRGFSLESFQAGLKQHPECRLIVSYAGLPGDLSLENCREWLPASSLVLIEGNPEMALNLQREGAPIDLIIRPRADQDLPPPGTLVEGSPEEVFKRYFTPSMPTKN